MDRQRRNHLFHESEHLLVVVLLGIVLFQAVQVSQSGEGQTETGAGAEPVVIVPATEAFDARAGQEVTFPWIVVNKLERPVTVRSGIALDWEHATDTPEQGVTALLVQPVSAGESLAPGDHTAYEYTFTVPETPGMYRLTLTAESGDRTVTQDVAMRVVS